jgi:hypothetical protein
VEYVHAKVARIDEVVFPVRRRHPETHGWFSCLCPIEGMVIVMREDITSSSFLAVIVVSLIVVCVGFIALGS